MASSRSMASMEAAAKILNAALCAFNHTTDRPTEIAPFVTVSRQPGVGAIWFSHRLADRLNRNGAGDWSAWDRELVEKVSAEHGIDKEILQTISDRRHNWLKDLFESFAVSYTPSEEAEARAYERVVMTIRALAATGHAIIVGRGGVYITEGMPGGIHLRLVAPLEHRMRQVAERDQISIQEAAAQIAETERSRDEFYRHYWPNRPLLPENYTLTLNSAALSVEEMVECVLPVIRARQSNRRRAHSEDEHYAPAKSAPAAVKR